MNCIGLPEGWRLLREIDLAKDKRLFLRVNLLCAGISAALAAAGTIIRLLALRDVNAAPWGWQLLAGMLSMIAYMVLHEAVHGAFIWYYSGKRPSFGFGGGYAWAGLTDGYFDRKSYVIIALSPVVLWGIVLSILLLLLPRWFSSLWFIQLMNLGGAAGDYYVTREVSRMPAELLCNDTGVAMRFYVKEDMDHDDEA